MTHTTLQGRVGSENAYGYLCPSSHTYYAHTHTRIHTHTHGHRLTRHTYTRVLARSTPRLFVLSLISRLRVKNWNWNYLSRTSPHSNHSAWNSRIWHFQEKHSCNEEISEISICAQVKTRGLLSLEWPLFLSFFLWFGRPKPITGLSGCWTPD